MKKNKPPYKTMITDNISVLDGMYKLVYDENIEWRDIKWRDTHSEGDVFKSKEMLLIYSEAKISYYVSRTFILYLHYILNEGLPNSPKSLFRFFGTIDLNARYRCPLPFGTISKFVVMISKDLEELRDVDVEGYSKEELVMKVVSGVLEKIQEYI